MWVYVTYGPASAKLTSLTVYSSTGLIDSIPSPRVPPLSVVFSSSQANVDAVIAVTSVRYDAICCSLVAVTWLTGAV